MDDLPDPTDWKGTALPELQTIDSGLRCQICKEYYLSPVITSCSHTFCSLCIRRVLASDHQCPVCRTKEQETKLRKNTAMDELVDAFQESRASLLKKANELVYNADNQSPLDSRQKRKRRRNSVSDVSVYSITSSSSGGSTRHQKPRKAKQVMIPGTASCPVCSRPVVVANINQHLDFCVKEDSRATETVVLLRPEHTKLPSSNHSRKIVNKSAKSVRAFDQLPKINYALYNESKLRAKLTELGIPTYGGKPLLERRHTEWVNIWNANTDSANPDNKYTLLHRLDVWERALSGYNQRQTDLDPTEWNHSHQEDFKALIQTAREGPNRPERRIEPRKSLTDVFDK